MLKSHIGQVYIFKCINTGACCLLHRGMENVFALDTGLLFTLTFSDLSIANRSSYGKFRDISPYLRVIEICCWSGACACLIISPKEYYFIGGIQRNAIVWKQWFQEWLLEIFSLFWEWEEFSRISSISVYLLSFPQRVPHWTNKSCGQGEGWMSPLTDPIYTFAGSCWDFPVFDNFGVISCSPSTVACFGGST